MPPFNSQLRVIYLCTVAASFTCCALAKSVMNQRSLAENELNFSFNDMEQCQAVCVDIFFLLPDNPQAVPACQRGCRMFNIVYLRDDRNLNNSKDECYSSCGDAYAELDLNSACCKGCKNMLRKKQSELEAVIIYIEQDVKNIDNPQPELEELEVNWFIENYAAKDLHYLDGQKDYKIPESMYKTLPIESLMEELTKSATSRPSGDWLDCASRNSGIPKWILVSAIIAAIMVALYLSISSERKVVDEILLIEDEIEKHVEAGPLPVKVPLPDNNRIDMDVTKAKDIDVEMLTGGAHLEESEFQGDDVVFSGLPKYLVEKEMV